METEQAIEEAYRKGEISKREYLELRIKMTKAMSNPSPRWGSFPFELAAKKVLANLTCRTPDVGPSSMIFRPIHRKERILLRFQAIKRHSCWARPHLDEVRIEAQK